MKILLCILAMSILGFMGSRWSFSHFRLPQFATQLFLTGSEFILVGVFLGPSFLNILSESVLVSLHPIRALCLGWIGFNFGLQLDFKVLREFPREYHRIALFLPVTIGCIMCIPMYFALVNLFGYGGISIIPATLVISFAAANTAPSSLAIFQKHHLLQRSQLITLFRFVSGLDSFPGILATGIAGVVVSTHLPNAPFLPPAITWFVIISLTGFLLGAILILLMDTNPTDQEVAVYLTGVIVLIGGLGFYFHHSCLYMAALAGLMASRSKDAHRLHALSSIPERTIYIILLLLTAASIDIRTSIHLGFILMYLMFRFSSKLIAGSVAASIWGRWPLTHRSLGLGLLSEGGMTIAMMAAFAQILPGPVSDTLIASVLVTIIIHDVVSPYALHHVFERAGKV